MAQAFFIFLLIVISVFMILLIMIQRGKGGGLAGAFGGMGGQSAFGTKAGDTFTKITVYTALIWFSLCVITLMVLNGKGGTTSILNVDSGKISAPAKEVDSPQKESTGGAAPVDPTTPATPATATPANSTPTPASAPATNPAPAAPAESK